ncbi:MAG TPA: hypothetical protein VKX39_16325 [Bryobacteraceae bacterium]|nr:hypothetical protein [Bryobacteraceae bacterium]
MEQFDPVAFGRFARSRWKVITGAVAASVAFSAIASLLLPRRYTATASLIIELPAGSDPRAAAALSPVYLESLKTYEHFAASDSLFQDAIRQLGIRPRAPRKTIESLKSSVLRITRPASTRVLDISVTLGNPVEAQRLAQYLAERTVDLNRSIQARSSAGLERQSQAIYEAAAARLERANRAREDFSRSHPVEALSAGIQNMTELRFDLQRNLQEAEASLEDLQARAADSNNAPEIAGMRARVAALKRQDRDLGKKIDADSAALENLRETRDQLDAEQQSARAEATAARNRWDELRSSLAYQGERVSVLDPGTVPEQPSFPNLPLNAAVALVLSLGGSLFWAAARYGYQRFPAETERRKNVYSLAD